MQDDFRISWQPVHAMWCFHVSCLMSHVEPRSMDDTHWFRSSVSCNPLFLIPELLSMNDTHLIRSSAFPWTSSCTLPRAFAWVLSWACSCSPAPRPVPVPVYMSCYSENIDGHRRACSFCQFPCNPLILSRQTKKRTPTRPRHSHHPIPSPCYPPRPETQTTRLTPQHPARPPTPWVPRIQVIPPYRHIPTTWKILQRQTSAHNQRRRAEGAVSEELFGPTRTRRGQATGFVRFRESHDENPTICRMTSASGDNRSTQCGVSMYPGLMSHVEPRSMDDTHRFRSSVSCNPLFLIPELLSMNDTHLIRSSAFPWTSSCTLPRAFAWALSWESSWVKLKFTLSPDSYNLPFFPIPWLCDSLYFSFSYMPPPNIPTPKRNDTKYVSCKSDSKTASICQYWQRTQRSQAWHLTIGANK